MFHIGKISLHGVTVAYRPAGWAKVDGDELASAQTLDLPRLAEMKRRGVSFARFARILGASGHAAS
jgi:hypothetical protein